MITTVVNKNTDDFDIYIGRSSNNNKHFGNPFHIGRDGTREEVIYKFRLWLFGVAYTHIEAEQRKWVIRNLHVLRGKRLGCFCKPLPCHGDVYVYALSCGEIKV